MISEAYTVYDGAVKAFLPPFFCRSRGEAMRSFGTACNDKEHQFRKYSADYTLFFVGTFNDDNGLFERPATPERVISASEMVEDVDLFPPGRKLPM